MKLQFVVRLMRLTVDEVARAAGVTPRTLNRWEGPRGQTQKASTEPTIGQAAKLARYLGLTLDELFDDEEPLPKEIHRQVMVGEQQIETLWRIEDPQDLQKFVRGLGKSRPKQKGN